MFKIKVNYYDIFIYCLFIFIVLGLIVFLSAVFIMPFTEVGEHCENLNNQIIEYKKILEREFGQTFNSYNEYLVYKIENGGVN